MSTLYEIDRAIEQIIETGFAFDVETGEITYDESDLESLNEAFSEKLRACGMWVKNQRALARAIREEERSLEERRKRIERRVERIEDYMLRHIDSVGGKYESPEVGITTRRSSKVHVYAPFDLPSKFVVRKTEDRPDKDSIRKAIKAGEYVPGAELVETKTISVK